MNAVCDDLAPSGSGSDLFWSIRFSSLGLFETDTSKGHLSSLERGLLMPTVATLAVLAERLGVLVADIVNEPDAGDRARLLELSRGLGPGPLRKLVRDHTAASRTRSAKVR
jgi:transcriptional regulator with XRE-family HTH domain